MEDTEKILEFLCELCASVVNGDFKSNSLTKSQQEKREMLLKSDVITSHEL
jgi:hypothetical protein